MNSEKSSGEKNKQGREIGGMCVWKWERKLLNGNFLKTFIPSKYIIYTPPPPPAIGLVI